MKKIGRGFGDAKQNSRELEREREANLPKECIKGFIVRRATMIIWGRLTACFFQFRGHGSKEKEHRQFKDVARQRVFVKIVRRPSICFPALSC